MRIKYSLDTKSFRFYLRSRERLDSSKISEFDGYCGAWIYEPMVSKPNDQKFGIDLYYPFEDQFNTSLMCVI